MERIEDKSKILDSAVEMFRPVGLHTELYSLSNWYKISVRSEKNYEHHKTSYP